jgi:hypothetical protein
MSDFVTGASIRDKIAAALSLLSLAQEAPCIRDEATCGPGDPGVNRPPLSSLKGRGTLDLGPLTKTGRAETAQIRVRTATGVFCVAESQLVCALVPSDQCALLHGVLHPWVP